MINIEKAKDNVIEPQVVIDIIARHYNISEKKLTEKNRKREIVTIRKYASYCLVRFCKKYTLIQLCKYLGYHSEGSHATILFHYKDVRKKRQIYSKMKTEMDKLISLFDEYINTTLKIEGYTIQDAIDNPKILDKYK